MKSRDAGKRLNNLQRENTNTPTHFLNNALHRPEGKQDFSETTVLSQQAYGSPRTQANHTKKHCSRKLCG